jgi:hypothetical protein
MRPQDVYQLLHPAERPLAPNPAIGKVRLLGHLVHVIRPLALTGLAPSSLVTSTPAQDVSISDPSLNAAIREALQNGRRRPSRNPRRVPACPTRTTGTAGEGRIAVLT